MKVPISCTVLQFMVQDRNSIVKKKTGKNVEIFSSVYPSL